MADRHVSVCYLCNDAPENIEENLKILPCGHSFCLKCLELTTASVDSPKCPRCGVAYEIPEGGLKDLKKNEFVDNHRPAVERQKTGGDEFVECLKKLSIYERSCDSCMENQAVNFCVDCSFNYCSTCLQCHGKNPASRNHRLQQTRHASESMGNYDNCQICMLHSEKMNLFCEDCNIDTCVYCITLVHNKHQLKHISDKYNEMKGYLDLKLKMKEKEYERSVENVKYSVKVWHDCKTNAAKLKKEIKQRGDEMKGLVDSIVAEMSAKVDKELTEHEDEASVVIAKLKKMQTDMKILINSLKQQLIDLNFQNISEINSGKLNEKVDIPTYDDNFKLFLKPFTGERRDDLDKIMGRVHRKVQPELLKKIDLEKACSSACGGRNELYVSYSQEPLVGVFDASGSELRSNKDLRNYFVEILDSEVVDDKLFVLGRQQNTLTVVEISAFVEAKVVYQIESGSSNPMLSKSPRGNLIVNLKTKLILLSDDWKFWKEVSYINSGSNLSNTARQIQSLPFGSNFQTNQQSTAHNIESALQVDDGFVALFSETRDLSSKMCKGVSVLNDRKSTRVDHHSDVVGGYEFPKKTTQRNQPAQRFPVKCLARDSFGNIFVINERKLFVLKQDMEIICSVELPVECSAISYDEFRNTLLLLGADSSGKCILMIYKL